MSSDQKPWEPIDGESKAAFSAFLAFRDLTQRPRTLLDAFNALKRLPGKASEGPGKGLKGPHALTQAPGHIRKWSAQFRWHHRAAAWDGYLAASTAQAVIETTALVTADEVTRILAERRSWARDMKIEAQRLKRQGSTLTSFPATDQYRETDKGPLIVKAASVNKIVAGARLLDIADRLMNAALRSELAALAPVVNLPEAGEMPTVDEARASELARLEAAAAWVYTAAANGDREALGDLFKVMERKARLLGLDAPQAMQPTSQSGQPVPSYIEIGSIHANGNGPPPMSPAAPNQSTIPELYERKSDGGLRLNFHAGQQRAWASSARFIGVLAGTQSGKTSWGPWWLHREIYDPIVGRGPGDYLAVTSTYDLFKLKMLPAIRDVFEGILRCGRYWGSARVIELADPNGRFWARRADDPMWGRIILRSAESGSGLESSTARAAWLDEAGQDKFTDETWRAVLRRLSLAIGRCLITTTLYNFNWLKTDFYDRYQAGDTDYDVIHFDSTENPAFSQEEFDRAARSMPAWRFNMQYCGRYERPAGMIYDCFLDGVYPFGHLVKRFMVPAFWPRFVGLDFGGSNTAAVLFAHDPQTALYYAYREYHSGGLTAAGHAKAIRAGEPEHLVCVGGSSSEGQWRQEFHAGGLHVFAPDVSEVEIGISRVYGAIREGRVFFMDDLAETLKQLRSYSRKLDKTGQPTSVIDSKAKYHQLDAIRYILGWLFSPEKTGGLVGSTTHPATSSRWGAHTGG